MRTRLKVCGITREDDLRAAANAGADAVGLVFYRSSKRFLALDRARALRHVVPAFVDLVALFVNATDDDITQVQRAVRPDLLQFHGDETPIRCRQFGQSYLKAFRVGAPGLTTPKEVLAQCMAYSDAAGWLFDSYSPAYGGSGANFDYSLLDDVLSSRERRPVILAGGLQAENVGTIAATLSPWGVDVSSGVEDGPGEKSHAKIRSFAAALRRGDEERESAENHPAD